MLAQPVSPPPPTHTPGAPWSIPETAQFLKVSTRHVHRLIDGGKVRSLKLGRRRLIADAEVQRLAREGC
jgi:excisionase family DNA binding protein